MKETPILFNGEMVRAIIEGKKTQTRRPIKDVPSYKHLGRDIMKWPLSGVYADNGKFFLDVQTDVDDCWTQELRCPFGCIDDHLWVRETFCGYIQTSHEYDEWREATTEEVREQYPMTVEYLATSESHPDKWRPSIHMPRWASRITLKVTDIRVQRVQEISEEDAIAEGCFGSFLPAYCAGGEITGADGEHPSDEFGKLWQSIYGTWDANPWVWAATFEVVK